MYKISYSDTLYNTVNIANIIITSKWSITFKHCELLYCTPVAYIVQFSRSVVSDSLQPHESQHSRPPCPSPTPMSIESVMPSSHLILCRPFLLLPPIPPGIRVFSSESTLRIR